MYGSKRLFKYDEQAMLDANWSVQTQEIKSVSHNGVWCP